MDPCSTTRSWKACFKEETPRKSRYKIRKQIKKVKQTGAGVTTSFLLSVLSLKSNFLGVFPQDYLLALSIKSFPVSLIINLDFSTQPGSHWLAIKIDETSVYIFDSLGLNPDTWSYKPDVLFFFLSKFRNHKFYCTRQIQNPYSPLCGLYALYFTILDFRFSELLAPFTTDFKLNDTILCDLLK